MGNIINYYSAKNIDVDDIATNSTNKNILRRLRRNEAGDTNNELYINSSFQNHLEQNGETYHPEGAYDMEWLGYFIGKNQHLRELNIRPFEPPSGSSVSDVLGPFFRGVSCNKSIRAIDLAGMDMLGGEIFTMLGPFLKNNYNLTTIYITECDFGDEGCRLFALAIGSITHNSLEMVGVGHSDIEDEGMVDIITALRVHRHLEHLDLSGNRLRKNGCVALATLLRSATELQYLDLCINEINDEGIQALVPALKNLRKLWMSDNPSITTRGWQSFATIFEASNSNLEVLDIDHNNVDDQAVAAFAKTLTNNRRLKEFHMPTLSEDGLQAFSKLLCNTTSVNATFLSNHSIYEPGENQDLGTIIDSLLDLNRRGDKKVVAMIKILQSHEDFDMLPFFQWEFKVLPLALGWLKRASECEMPDDFEPNIDGRKLSTIYQFVRDMPVLYVQTRLLLKELEDIKSEESQMEEKFEKEQQRLQQEFNQRKQYLQERKEIIMKNLGVGGNRM